MSKLYYVTPSDEIFNEVKSVCLRIRKDHDFCNEKTDYIKTIENVKDNFMYLVAIFDDIAIPILASNLSTKAKKEIYNRLIAWGDTTYNYLFK